MNVLIVGGGGREHAIATALQTSPKIAKLYCAPGNGGIEAAGVTVLNIKASDIDGLVAFSKQNSIDFVVVAPDDPLAMGLVDALTAVGIKSFGPNKAAARIESSKVFSKDLMKKYNIPTAKYKTFNTPQAAYSFLDSLNELPIVIKADGLALGKGVIIAESLDEAKHAIKSIMSDKIFGESGNNVVIEQFITGPEVSVLAFCDGQTVLPMVSSMDHKRAYDGNKGPNTGGMGTIAPNPFYTAQIAATCMEEIFLPTIRAMQAEGCPFSGCLYFGLMLTANGPKVIEYNCRFGDPETQVVLPLLETDLFEIMLAISDKKLADMDINWKTGGAACVVLASGGYPENYTTGLKISGLPANGQVAGASVYHAGTKLLDGEFYTCGGRVLGITCTDLTLEDAIKNAYTAASKISFEGMQLRSDIGSYTR